MTCEVPWHLTFCKDLRSEEDGTFYVKDSHDFWR